MDPPSLIEDDSFPAESGNGRATCIYMYIYICRQYMRDLWRTWLRNRHESKQWNELVLGQPAFWTGEPTLWYCCIDRQWSYIVYLPRGDKYFSISCVSNVEIIALEEFFSRVDKMLKRKKGEKERGSRSFAKLFRRKICFSDAVHVESIH